MIDEIERLRVAMLARHEEEMAKLDELDQTLFGCDAEIRQRLEALREGHTFRRSDNLTAFVDMAHAITEMLTFSRPSDSAVAADLPASPAPGARAVLQ